MDFQERIFSKLMDFRKFIFDDMSEPDLRAYLGHLNRTRKRHLVFGFNGELRVYPRAETRALLIRVLQKVD